MSLGIEKNQLWDRLSGTGDINCGTRYLEQVEISYGTSCLKQMNMNCGTRCLEQVQISYGTRCPEEVTTIVGQVIWYR